MTPTTVPDVSQCLGYLARLASNLRLVGYDHPHVMKTNVTSEELLPGALGFRLFVEAYNPVEDTYDVASTYVTQDPLGHVLRETVFVIYGPTGQVTITLKGDVARYGDRVLSKRQSELVKQSFDTIVHVGAYANPKWRPTFPYSR